MSQHRRRLCLPALLAAVVLALTGCDAGDGASGGETGAPSGDEVPYGALATWELTDPGPVTRESDSLELMVMRSACADGRTGPVQDIDVTYEDDRIVLQAYTEELTGEHTCPLNEPTHTEVSLDEPVGDRILVDGACEAERISGIRTCETAVRWSPEPGNEYSSPHDLDDEDLRHGQAALWEPAAPERIAAESTRVDIAVTRIACASGETGDVELLAVIEASAVIVIHAVAAPLDPAEHHTCQDNEPTVVSVDLEEPVGRRELVDGGCDLGRARWSEVCQDATRWSPGSG